MRHTETASIRSGYHMFAVEDRTTECLEGEAEDLRTRIDEGKPMYNQYMFFAHLQALLEDVVSELLRRGKLFVSCG